MPKNSVLQFKITLQGSKPPIWRRIQLSEHCSFWDLHVAIQDAMGWLDCHLHHFDVVDPDTSEEQRIGIPCDDGFDDNDILPGWHHKVKDYLCTNEKMNYLYDYGDHWDHLVQYEGVFEAESKVRYPLCLAGKRACPPEDVGGIPGYYNFLEIITDPEDDEHESMLEWVGEDYAPDHFNPKEVKFTDPEHRWKQAFEGEFTF